jgi:dTDP-4-dehydrorhamnose 3,5-epimerase
MEFIETGIKDLWEIIPEIYRDHRGYFMETFQLDRFSEKGISGPFVQENQSFSKKGVLRGLHFQKQPHAQGKLIRVIFGEILDVVVDLRRSSPTYGKHYTCLLDDKQNKILYVPEGMAHGFLALKDSLFIYRCTRFYHRESEAGILWNDPDLGINWGIATPLLSEKDAVLPSFNEVMEKL